jgi:beta-glucosidase
MQATLVGAPKRGVPHTLMKWEIYPEGIYLLLKKFAAYPEVKSIIVTENGAAFPDHLINGEVNDTERSGYLEAYIRQVLRAKAEGVPVDGYFVWSLTDNFEWAEGYYPRFGLIHVDYSTQKRTIKSSALAYGKWIREYKLEAKCESVSALHNKSEAVDVFSTDHPTES